jgi:hypothetical protein
MTHVHVEAGICGFHTDVRVSKIEGWNLKVTLESTCELVSSLGDELEEMGMKDILTTPINQNPVYLKAGKCNMHSSCIVPCGILKAAEAELGCALKKAATVSFEED